MFTFNTKHLKSCCCLKLYTFHSLACAQNNTMPTEYKTLKNRNFFLSSECLYFSLCFCVCVLLLLLLLRFSFSLDTFFVFNIRLPPPYCTCNSHWFDFNTASCFWKHVDEYDSQIYGPLSWTKQTKNVQSSFFSTFKTAVLISVVPNFKLMVTRTKWRGCLVPLAPPTKKKNDLAVQCIHY